MHRFHISDFSKSEVILNKEESRHALAVLRVKTGEVVELLDGKGGVFQGIVSGTDRGAVKVSVMAKREEAPNPVALTLAASVIKPEAMEFLIQKACELGVHAVVPVISERTVVRLSRERWEAKAERWRKIARESCKQCGQSRMPAIQPVTTFKDLLNALPEHDLALIPTLAGQVAGLYPTLKAHTFARSILLFIGPEGDFSPGEVSQALEKRVRPVSLGPLVLRSETAALYALSVLGFFYREAVLEGKK